MSDIVSQETGERTALYGKAATQTNEPSIDWQRIANDDDYRELIRVKRNFIVPATLFFLAYYFGFLIFVGYFPTEAETNVIGNINIAYLLALSQFAMTWMLVFLYVQRAGLFDKLADAILKRVKGAR